MGIETGGIGDSVLRKEDGRFLTGRGRYTDDLNLPDQLYAIFVRSPHAHARIDRVDVDAARALPSVVAVFTGTDVRASGMPPLSLDFATKFSDGRPMAETPRYVLTADIVRYVGEPVAMVIGTTLDAARDGAEAVIVDYTALPSIADTAGAVAPTAPTVWANAPGNVACEVRLGNAEATAKLFATAAKIVRARLVNQRVLASPMEPRVAIAKYDPFDQHYTLYVSHQCPHPLQTHLAHLVGTSEERFRVISYDVGGGFGVKGSTYPEEAAVCWAAGKLGRTIQWRCERTELFLSDTHARDHVTELEMAVDADGHFLALRFDDIANIGGYFSSFGAGPPLLAAAMLTAGPYLTRSIAGRVRMVFTNMMPTDAYRGPGRAEVCYWLERMADAVARECGLAPAEVRRRNLVPQASMPYRSPVGRVYDCGDFPGGLSLALERADMAGFVSRRAASERRGKLRGVGLSSYIDHTGMGPSDIMLSHGAQFGAYESAQVRFGKAGGVTVYTGTHSHGQGLETALAQLVADRFGLPIDRIEVRHGDTNDAAAGRGTVGARSLIAGGGAIEAALDKIVAKGKRIAAHQFECSVADVEFARGVFNVAGTDRRTTIDDIVRSAYFPVNFPLKELEPGLDEGGYWDPKGVSIPNGCYVCEVEVDPETGAVTIERFVCVDDFGVVVNPMIVEGQVHGGVAQALGQAFLENAVYDVQSGQLLAGSLTDYALPRADDLPSFETSYNNHPTATNPLGVKGCGEAGAIGAPAAYVNAVLDALFARGVRHLDMPVTREQVWRALTGAKANYAD